MRRRWAALAAAAAVVATAPASGQDGGAAIPDGDWQGVFVYSAALDFDAGVAGDTSGTGRLTMTVTGGQVTGGTFAFSASTTITIEGGGGTAQLVSEGGTITGPAGAPLATPGDLQMTGEFSTNGITVPVAVTIPATELSGLVLAVDAAGCDRVSGDMSQELTETFEEFDVAVPRLEFRWSAVRAGADDATLDALGTELGELDKLVAAAARGDLDPAALGDVLGRADEIAGDLPATGGCDAGTFSTPLSGGVADLLAQLVDPPGEATGGQLWAAVNAGVRTGVLRPGSPLASQVADALAARLDAGADAIEAYSIHLAARAVGDDDLAARALEAAG